MKHHSFREDALTWIVFLPVVLWLGALAATAYREGMNLLDWMGSFAAALEHPLRLAWTPHTPAFLLGAAALYAGGIFLYYSTRQNRRPGEEQGSAGGAASGPWTRSTGTETRRRTSFSPSTCG